ncbi:hypothetical protein MNBD_GAMMA02-775 [hydrothermal vent metagenome]|uniref:Uncharacterized protein n=1 Tax=hydrothermal vent metagenome TaxID=652676 RepID=A0A3B0W776_9ZZZZ
MKNNLFANGLLVLIGVLLLLAALQLFGWGRGTQSLEAEPFDASTLSQLEVAATEIDGVKIDDKGMVQITDAPLFSYDRQPYIPTIEGSGIEGEDRPAVVAEPLKARVTSIIIIDENSYAMVFDELSKERVTLTKGMPLPGDQGLWTVDIINPRAVTFVAEGEEPVEIGLDVFDGQLNARLTKRNKRNNKKKPKSNKQAKTNNQQAKKNSAEEIRKKIAERRAQMRANAAKGNKE